MSVYKITHMDSLSAGSIAMEAVFKTDNVNIKNLKHERIAFCSTEFNQETLPEFKGESYWSVVLIPKDSTTGNALIKGLRNSNRSIYSDDGTYFLVVFRTERAMNKNKSAGLYGASAGLHHGASSSAYGGASSSNSYGGSSSSAYGTGSSSGTHGLYQHQAASSSSSSRDRVGDRGGDGNGAYGQPRGSNGGIDTNYNNSPRSFPETTAATAPVSTTSHFPTSQPRPTVTFSTGVSSMSGEISRGRLIVIFLPLHTILFC